MPSRKGKYLYETELGASLVREELENYSSYSEPDSPTYHEITSSDELRDANRVANSLQSIDWSFTSDDTGFLTHDVHPYPAKFIPQIPGHCIAQLSLRGELVLDPFGGSGTTALEAVRLGRRAVSVDANPIGTLIGQVKTCNLDQTAAKELHAIRTGLTNCIFNLPKPEKLCQENNSYLPEISNIDKWFPITSRAELAFIKSRIDKMESEKARQLALLALSRIILAVSFQDSETRYSSKPRFIPEGETLKRFLGALHTLICNVIKTQPTLRYGVCNFVTADSRKLTHVCQSDSVDLVVTSPPYGNANDYHLYHRFRLIWLGYDPRELGRIEIGSHLRHQKESSGFDSYLQEMEESLSGVYRVLRPGRYAVLVVGDAIYSKVLYRSVDIMNDAAQRLGFESVCILERPIHSTKRSFVAAGRRATTEKLLVLRKPPAKLSVWFMPPPYRLWPYETELRTREIEALLGIKANSQMTKPFSLHVDSYTVPKTRKLVFTHGVGIMAINTDLTWQAIIENGFASQPSARKDPKYVTHGLHSYKGKFYPQLAKALMNLCALPPGSNILDPFCGSGTTLLESYLNGHRSFGCDMNPLAAKIARAKIGILDVNPDVVRETVGTLISLIEDAPPRPAFETYQFDSKCWDEIRRWFPAAVVAKLNWLLGAIRSISEGILRDFFEIVLSSIIREVSQQEPNDLRIRRRKKSIHDADVFKKYMDALDIQYARIEKFWSVRGYSPDRFHTCKIIEGDSRSLSSFKALGVEKNNIDLVLTSPPYATALPYIDTDRLSLLVLFGMDSSARRPVEQCLIGSREIITKERRLLELELTNSTNALPKSVCEYLLHLHHRISESQVGFRRKNMPALLLRFFQDIDCVLRNCYQVLKPGGEAMIIIGDNRMQINGRYERIATTDFVQEIALNIGMELVERMDISVTTENMLHLKNAIRENVVLRFKSKQKLYQA